MPLSRDPTQRQRQLANLWRGRPAAPSLPAELSALELRIRQLTPQSPEVRRIVAEVLAVQSELAQPQPQDAPLVGLLAMSLHLARLAAADIIRWGFERDGKERPAVKVFLEATRRAAELCDRLGIGPAARARMGLGGARSLDDLLAEALRESARTDAQAAHSAAPHQAAGDAGPPGDAPPES